ncbi:MotA/TolQ/ExbB proton channel family protein [Halioxenophilus sp. WMMB6]|uniref:MotA/TolQ/ExbB proton channel family protein n=1 Tax=Halioxenophilus sp. WMMB6 TaxID=3073815 RepID=UPI00295E2854|nr:MotA/TolQ/ExbB proton channel family protein [Halioxenophilus sp. WMMB6]
MFQFKGQVLAFLACWVVVLPLSAAEAPFSVDQLLRQVEQGRDQDRQLQAERLKNFIDDQKNQKQLLVDIIAEEERQQALSTQQEQAFASNEQELALLQERLNQRLGGLTELFGVLQQVASDANAQFSNSITQLHYPERSQTLLDFSVKMGQTKELPSIVEIERLWFEMQREMTALGKVVQFDQPVLTAEGVEVVTAVTRIGGFNLVANGHYLQFIPETGRVVEYGRQPANRYLQRIKNLESSNGEVALVAVDPTRGQLLELLVKAPSLRERIAQGGVIGYIIIALGIVSITLALVRFTYLTLLQVKIEQQVRQADVPGDNPLGRILAVYAENKHQDTETLELKLGEAVLREIPKINRGLSFLKIIAAVAPLLGLLGTVTGMIVTFQAITLFGAGDPKLMAGGISQALVTTVLGLTVAIPTLLLHNLLQTRAEQINDILQQEGVAIVAGQAEQNRVVPADQNQPSDVGHKTLEPA